MIRTKLSSTARPSFPGSRCRVATSALAWALLIAALAAEGTSVIHNARQIDRGYQDVDGRLRALGASVETARVETAALRSPGYGRPSLAAVRDAVSARRR